MKYCVFTLIMQAFDAENVVRVLKDADYDGVEWRVSDDGRHISVEELQSKGPHLRELCEDAGLEIPLLSTSLDLDEIERIKLAVEGAVTMGSPQIRLLVPALTEGLDYDDLLERTRDRLMDVAEVAGAAGLRILLETHPGNIIPSASAAWRLVGEFDPVRIGIIYDPGNIIYEGLESWRLGVNVLGEYLAHVHVKNTQWVRVQHKDTGDAHWTHEWTTLRDGIVDWFEVMRALKEYGYDGYLSLEDFSSEKSTTAKLADGIRYLKEIEARLR